jgi:hypothetical protein
LPILPACQVTFLPMRQLPRLAGNGWSCMNLETAMGTADFGENADFQKLEIGGALSIYVKEVYLKNSS